MSEIIEQIVITVITVLCSSIAMYLVGKKISNDLFDDKFEEILAYLSTPEGQQSVRNLGAIFASGISKGIGLGGSPIKGKTFGVPNMLIYELLNRFGPKIEEKAKSKEVQPSTVSKFG